MATRQATLEEAKQVLLFVQAMDNLFPGWEYMKSEDVKWWWDYFKELGYIPF